MSLPRHSAHTNYSDIASGVEGAGNVVVKNDEIPNAGQEGNYRSDIIGTNQKVIHSTLYHQHLHDVHRFCTVRSPCFCCRCCCSSVETVTMQSHCATLAVVSLVTTTAASVERSGAKLESTPDA